MRKKKKKTILTQRTNSPDFIPRLSFSRFRLTPVRARYNTGMSNEEPIKVKYRDSYLWKHPKFTGCLVDDKGTKSWYKNGQWHIENGPAIEYANVKRWYLYGIPYTEQEHRLALRRMKMKMLDTSQSTL